MLENTNTLTGRFSLWDNVRISAKNLTTIRGLTLGGILVALHVVLGLFKIPLSPDNRISLTFIAMVTAGYVLGPIPAMIVGILGDLIGCMVAPSGTYFFGFTISAALSGLINGCCLYKKQFKYIFLWLILARLLMTFGVNIILNTYWLSVLYNKAANFLAVGRIIKNLISLPIQIIVSFSIITIIEKNGFNKKFAK